MAPNQLVYDPLQPEGPEREIAGKAARAFARHLEATLDVRLAQEDEIITLPKEVVKMMVDLLSTMAEGQAVTLIPFHAELTTQQAADFLGVSRPFIIKQLEEGNIPYHMVGSHRRVRFADIREYQVLQQRASTRALDELASLGQEIGSGYE
jgi:excisionase family DNA binding protein